MERDVMIAAGFGFRSGATIESLRAALMLAGANIAPDLLATAEIKARHAAFIALARTLGLALRPVPQKQLIAQVTLTQSCASQSAYGTGSVAEAAALAAAGPGARLIGVRHISPDRMASCAIAEGEGT
ncbi:cobalamin biosynthesis protein [Marivita sp. S0852]|uniref:cobalamin biosynthesis protein n=1 Tax=Marivita sp. S0852 TaxID=3373893 RepID=UPI00398253E9